MRIALCHNLVFPFHGGCGTYIIDLARRLVADNHEVHLLAWRWDDEALPRGVHCHAISAPWGPRFLRPWHFSRRCENVLRGLPHDVSIGFDKTWGQDVLYPQGGLHAACFEYNLQKYRNSLVRAVARAAKLCDLTHWSYRRLEKKQYLGPLKPTIVVNSQMVRRHFEQYHGMPPENLHVIYSSVDAGRFPEQDRLRRRVEYRAQWGIGPEETVALFAAIHYRLKGLEPLLHAVRQMTKHPEFTGRTSPFRLLVAGHKNHSGWRRLAKRLGIANHVKFVGYCDDMRNAYFASDFLVHPTFYDPCSLVVLEALACGLPVITSRANGVNELLHPLQEGYIVDDPHDYKRLAWSIWQLLDPQRRSACSQAARKTASQWTFEHHYRLLMRVLSETAARKHAA